MNAVCTNCGTTSTDQARFCSGCGRPVAGITSSEKTRPNPPPLDAAVSQALSRTTVLRPAILSQLTSQTAIRPASAASQREHTAYVTDISPSMGERYDGQRTKLEAAIRAGAALVLQKFRIDPQDEVALVTFDQHAYVILPFVRLAEGKDSVIQALHSLNTDTDGTDINAGLKAASDLFDWSQSNVVRRIVLLTDGQGGHPLRTAEDLKSRGVIIDVTGIGDSPANVDEKLLKKVASVVNGELRYRFIKDQRTLIEVTTTHIATKAGTA